MTGLDRHIASDIGALLARLESFGYVVTDSSYAAEHFGNYHVDLRSPSRWVRIVRDRRCYQVESESNRELKEAGLFRGFESRHEFEAALTGWLERDAPLGGLD
jgi:hypothetical protein